MENVCNEHEVELLALLPSEGKFIDATQEVIDKLVELHWLRRSPISGDLVKTKDFKAFETKIDREIVFSINENIAAETQSLENVIKVYWSRQGKSKASRTHLTKDRSKTLCGYRIPGEAEFDEQYRRLCRHCLDEAEEME